MSNQFNLLREKRFLPFFVTQFLGAFNDNVFKTALITLVTFRAGQLTTLDGKTLATLLPGLFILPFFVFSATSGQLADKFDKDRVARAVKVFEIAVMCLAAWGFVTQSLAPLVAALFLMGLHSTIFGPVKYAYLPQHLAQNELVGGNGLVEMGTFVAILLGQILGAWLISSSDSGHTVAVTLVSIAVVGWLMSRSIPRTPASDATLHINWNPLTETFANLRFARGNRVVWLSILGISWFWFYGATLLAQFPSFAKDLLGGDESVFILLLTVFSLGVGSGSLLCEKLSGGRVELGLVPFGAIGLTLFGVDLYLASPEQAEHGGNWLALAATHWRVLADIALIGLFGGFYIVPLYALIQTRSEKSHQSRIIAANNILNAAFMVVSAGVTLLLFRLGLTIPQLFLATALFNAVVAIYIYTLVPEFLMRFIVWILIHTVYRLESKGLENVPDARPGGSRLQSCQLRRCAGHHRSLSAADPLRHGPQHLPHANSLVRLSHQSLHPDRLGQGRPGAAGEGLRRHRFSAGRRRPGRHLSRRPHHRYRRAVSVQERHPPHRRTHTGAGGADGVARPVGQLLFAQGRAGDEPAAAPRSVQQDRAGRRRAGRAGRRDTR